MPTHEAQLLFEIQRHVEVVLVLRKLFLGKVEGCSGWWKVNKGKVVREAVAAAESSLV
jgi:hypothetical protein